MYKGWVTLMSMPASALGARGLRYCDCCLELDREHGLYPRWRLPHQLAGAIVCPDHGVALRTIIDRTALWLLPPVCRRCPEHHSPYQPTTPASGDLQRLAWLARACIGAETLELSAIRDIAIDRLREIGASSWTVPLDRARIASWFRGVAISPALQSMDTSEARLWDGRWIHDQLRRRREEHPLLWMILWCALHADEPVERMAQRFVSVATQPAAWDAEGQGCLWSMSDAGLPAGAAALIRAAPTLKHAARTLGISVFTLRRELRALGGDGGEFHAPLKREQQGRLGARARAALRARAPGQFTHTGIPGMQGRCRVAGQASTRRS